MGARTIALAVAAAALVVAAPASGTTRYAGSGGLTVGSCTSAVSLPCTLDRALDQAVDGDLVLLTPGTYTRTTSTYVSKKITISGMLGGERPVLTGATSNQDVLSTFADGATVRYLTVRAAGPNAQALGIGGGDVAERVVTEATGTGGTALGLGGTARDSLARSTGATGLAVRAGGSVASPGRLRNMTIIADTGGVGVRVAGFLGGATGYFDEHADVRNSIVRGSPALLAVSAGSDASGAGTITVATSNVPAGSTQTSGAFASITDAGGNQTAPALLVDLAAGNVRQLAGSPTIDAGIVDAYTGAKDLDGDARPLGTAMDIGADELVPAAPVPPAAPPPAPPAAPAAPTAPQDQGRSPAQAPVLTGLALGTTRFRAAARGATISALRAPVGTLVVYDANVAAPATVLVERVRPGVRRGGRCRALKRGRARKPRCTRFVAVGRATRAGTSGTNRFRFSGRMSRRRLSPGAYRLVITARVAGAPASAPLTARFRIVR